MQGVVPPLPHEPTPWLVYPYGKRNKRRYGRRNRNHILCSLSQPHKIYRRRIPELCGDTYILNQCFNWFLLSQGKGNYSLWNPNKSNSIIHLPSLPFRSSIIDYALSSLPDDDTNCKVFLLQSRSILFIRLENKEWTEISCDKLMKGIDLDDDDYLYGLVSCKGKLYASSFRKRKLMTFDVDESDKLRIKFLCETPLIPANEFSLDIRLIESGGQLFYICIGIGGHGKISVGMDVDGKSFKQVIEVHVWKLNFSTMLWDRAEHLMGRAFFIDRSQNFSCPAVGKEQDNIYFNLPEDKALYSFNVRGGWLSVTLPCPRLPTPWSDFMFFRPDPRSYIHHDTKNIEKGKKDMVHVEEIEGVKASGLENLPLDVLNLIANCCDNIFDYMNFRATCRNFWLATPRLKLRRLQISPESPWLQFTTNNGCVQNFVDPKHGSRFLMSMTIPNSLAGTKLRYSKDGWMLMSDSEHSVSFYNPFTDQVIDLPNEPEIVGYFGLLFSISFSCIPTSSDCVVIGFGCCPLRVTLFTMTDKEWYHFVLDEDDYEFILNHSTPVFHKGAFYLLGKKGNLLTVNFSKEEPIVVEDWKIEHWDILHKPRMPCESLHRSFLLEWDGKLTSVFVGEMEVQVYVLNDAKMNWESVKSLEYHSFFLSQTSCVVKDATNTGMENRIYLPRFHGNGNDVLFYSLDTGRLHFNDNQDFIENLYDTREQVFASWIDPSYD